MSPFIDPDLIHDFEEDEDFDTTIHCPWCGRPHGTINIAGRPWHPACVIAYNNAVPQEGDA